MHSFGFKVVPSDDGVSGIPVAVAGQSMVDIQRLLTDIGGMIVRMELRIQNEVPEALLRKFDLSIGGSSASGLGSDPAEGSQEIMEAALNTLCNTLDYLGKGIVDTWMDDNYPDPVGRQRVAADLVALADDLKGYVLMYGPAESQRAFRGLDRDKLLPYAEARTDIMDGAAIGVISRDPVHKNRWVISHGPEPVPISFGDNISPADIPSFASAGPVIVIGGIARRDGAVSEVRGVTGCYSFPDVKYYRIVTADRDVRLLNPSIARPSYDASRRMWRLTNDDLGIDVSKPSWDEVSVAYNEYFLFLWETYYESGDEFEGEDKEIRDFLMSLAPVL